MIFENVSLVWLRELICYCVLSDVKLHFLYASLLQDASVAFQDGFEHYTVHVAPMMTQAKRSIDAWVSTKTVSSYRV